MRDLVIVLACVALSASVAVGQATAKRELEEQLAYLFPEAATFSAKEGTPPHYEAFGKAEPGSEPPLLGLAFWTTELDPLERGYDGPIKILVGMDTSGILARIIVTDHREPYGYFSVETPEFAEQFVGKDIRDRFRYGDDIDSVSRATISVTSASRAIRNSARRAATTYLVPPER